MKQFHKWLALPGAAAVLCLQLALGAAAAEPLLFRDVDSTSPWYDGVVFAVEHGISQGTGEDTFSPDDPITIRQWAVMLCRAYGLEVEALPDTLFGETELSQAYREGWLDMDAMLRPDTGMCRSAVYASAFAAENVPVYPYEFYEDGVPLTAAENYIRVGWENRLCGENAEPLELVTRGEAVQLLYQLHENGLQTEVPDVVETWDVHNPDEADLGPYLREIQKVPESILDEYIQRDWSFHVDSRAVDALGDDLGMSCTGFTNYQQKKICAKVPACVVHEFGHFYHHTLGLPQEIDKLYAEEAESACKVLGDYAATNSREYFAEFFEYWINWDNNEMRMKALEEAAPETYAYFLTLEELGA